MALGVLWGTSSFTQINEECLESRNNIFSNFWSISIAYGISRPLLHLPTRTTQKSMLVSRSFQKQSINFAFGIVYEQSKLDFQLYDSSQDITTLWRPKKSFHL